MNKFNALFLEKNGNQQSLTYKKISENQLMEGDTLVKIDYSTLNYKDALAITGKRPIIRKWPMIPGVDFAGIVKQTSNNKFSVGDKVVINGYGIGENHFGGFAEIARVNSNWLVKIPKNLNSFEAMSIGSAGLTSMLCIMEIQKHLSSKNGKILVTGATGGVGSIATMILSKLGFYVVVCSGKSKKDFLKSLGAKEVIERDFFNEDEKLLAHQEWHGVIDVVGSKTLAKILSQTYYGGIVVACGLAQGTDLPTNMMPFIIRAITLKGIESINTDINLKIEAWKLLSNLVDKQILKKLTSVIKFSEIELYSKKLINSEIIGRIVIDINQ